MYPSSALCRTQQSYQAQRAAHAPLENVRTVARKAALAWEQEALAAEQREERQSLTRATAEMLRKVEPGDKYDRVPSENPDRGLTSA